MSETPETEQSKTPQANESKGSQTRKRGGGLSSMLLADLKSMASGMGIAGAGSMKKAQLVEAIKASQAQPKQDQPQQGKTKQNQPALEQSKQGKAKEDHEKRGQGKQGQGKQDQPKEDRPKQDRPKQDRPKQDQPKQDQPKQDQPKQDQPKQDQPKQDQPKQGQQEQGSEEDNEGSRRNRRRRGRDRMANRAGGRNEPDTTILEDDVLVPAAGILDVLDNYAFVRTSGYLPGAEDVYLSLSMVRKFGLRRGDAVVGQVRQPREGERREKFNPMVRIETVNGVDPEAAKERVEFTAATPVHPTERLRLSTDASDTIGRVIDITTPVGKGQRGLVLAPPRSGTTTLLRSVATSIAANNPECHVMVVLVDTRPEEVTDFQRAVKGEVIASTFDREPSDHTIVAELAIERAKRLVELGHDVVVLLDSLTSLGRAYNLAAPANGRVLGGGVDASAVHPTKQFFGAARNIEDGGSLTILASAPVETGSAADEFFLEVIAGAANLELRLSTERALAGLVPAVDPKRSRTRHEELLLAPAEGAVVGDLRAALAAATTQQELVKALAGR